MAKKSLMTEAKEGAKTVASDSLSAAAEAVAGVVLDAAVKLLGTGAEKVKESTPKVKRAAKKVAKRVVKKPAPKKSVKRKKATKKAVKKAVKKAAKKKSRRRR